MAPFCSLTHFAPYHFYPGFNKYFFEYYLKEAGFEIIEIIPNGTIFHTLLRKYVVFLIAEVGNLFCNTVLFHFAINTIGAWGKIFAKVRNFNLQKTIFRVSDIFSSLSIKIENVLTDNGKEFTSHWGRTNHIFETGLREKNINHRYTKVRHPWTNGYV